MIPAAHIYAWQARAPWADIAQVEQDLVLSRAIVELFSEPAARQLLAFRGGTALHKLYLAPAARYSEDIDLVQVRAGPARPLFEVIQARLDPWLGAPKRKTRRNGIQLLYHFETAVAPVRRMRVKVEVNTREHFSVLGLVREAFSVDGLWFSGSAEVPTYRLEELLGTKLRAVYQRKKGRDVFDLWDAARRLDIDAVQVVRCLREYLTRQGLVVSRKEFEVNLASKGEDPAFAADISRLLRPGFEYEQGDGVRLVQEKFVALL